MLANIEALHAIHAICSENKPLTADLREWLARSLERYLGQDCDNLNDAFGVTQGHGGVPWWKERAIRQRDSALRILSRRYFDQLTVYCRAREISMLSRRYQGSCWPRDRRRESMPEHYRRTPKQYLWLAFRSGAKMPLSERRLRTLLGD
ncbi:MAG: hypothetical protein ACE5FS_02380 [Paracoccaceae bacterium]